VYRRCFALPPARHIRGRLRIPGLPIYTAVDLPVGCAGSVGGGTVKDDRRLVYVGYLDWKVVRIPEAQNCRSTKLTIMPKETGNDCESASI